MTILFLLLLPFTGGVTAFLLPRNRQRKILLIVVALGHLAIVFSLWQRILPVGFTGFLGLDVLGQLMVSIISFLFAMVAVYLWDYLKDEGPSNRIFVASLCFLLGSMTLVCVSVHMGLLWVALEATTLFSAPLINFERSRQSNEATWKYILICSVGIALALLGTVMLAIATGPFKSVFLKDLLTHAADLSPSWLKLSIIFLLVGYGTKMGLAPMHTWKPDAYAQAPAPIGGLLSGALTACPILAILRLVEIGNKTSLSSLIESLLLVMGLMSLGVAAIFILKQKDFSRLLAYSSVENMGLVALGLGLGKAAYWPCLFLIVNNALTKGFVFMSAGSLYQHCGSSKIEQIQGIRTRWPLMGFLLIIGLMSLGAIPPLGTFYSEIMILQTAIQSQHYGAAVIFVIAAAIIAIGLIQAIFFMFHEGPVSNRSDASISPRYCPAPVIILGLALLTLGLYVPGPLQNILAQIKVLLGG